MDQNGVGSGDVTATVTGATWTADGLNASTLAAGPVTYFAIETDAAGNILLGNTARSNGTNYDAVANNVCQVISATLSAAVLGNSGGVSPGTTSPWANLAL